MESTAGEEFALVFISGFKAKREKFNMVTCPWCGTSYLAFQSNCKNCGGPLPGSSGDKTSGEALATPPLAPRSISERYVWRLLYADGWWIAGLVLGILGAVFGLVGAGLTIGAVTAFVGIPFLSVGLPLFGIGGLAFIWRYQKARKVVNVLREGDATRGQIDDTQQKYSVRVNGRHPWVIRYQFRANGQEYTGAVSTLNQPGEQLQAGKPVYVLYLPAAPQWSSVYPHP